MAVSFPPNLSPAVQAASIQEYRNAAASQTAPLRYPQKSIGKDDDYLEIGVIKYVPPGFETGKNNLKLKTGTETNSNKKARYTIQLPIPANIGDTNQVNWGDDSMNPLAAFASEQIGNVLKSGNFAKGLIDAAREVGKTGTEKNSNQKALSTIQLPIPANIGDTNQVNWGNDSMNPLAAFASEQIGNVLKSGKLGKGIADVYNNTASTAKEIITKGGGQDLISKYFQSRLVNLLGANTTPEGLLSRASGSVLNPNLELLFSGVNLRSFAFDFDFAPRNSEESNVVKQIIRIFKQSMAPKTGSNTSGAGLFIDAPNVFILKYKTGNLPHPYLNTFKPCALTSMGVNYTGSGSYTTYADKTPVHMKLSLSFTELNPIYNEDYKEIPLSQGVGY